MIENQKLVRLWFMDHMEHIEKLLYTLQAKIDDLQKQVNGIDRVISRQYEGDLR